MISTVPTVPARAAVNSQLPALAAEGAPGVVVGSEEAAMSLSSVDAAKSVSTSTERGVAWSGVSGPIVGWAATGAAGSGVAVSRADTEGVGQVLHLGSDLGKIGVHPHSARPAGIHLSVEALPANVRRHGYLHG